MGEKGKEQQKTRVSFLERVPNKSPTVPAVKPTFSCADNDVRLIASPNPKEGKSGDTAESANSPPTPTSSQALSANAIKGLLSAALSGGAGGAAAAEMLIARQLQQQQAPAAAAAGQGCDSMHM